MASPISSPQNIVAINNMIPPPTWAEWFIVTVPICVLCDLFIWLLLVANYRPSAHVATVYQPHATVEKFTKQHYFIMGVTILTISLWCIEAVIQSTVGDMGI